MSNIDKKLMAIGGFYRESHNFIAKYKIGGKQKLQKIVGSDLFYKKSGFWYWNNPAIIKMTTTQLNKLTSKLK